MPGQYKKSYCRNCRVNHNRCPCPCLCSRCREHFVEDNGDIHFCDPRKQLLIQRPIYDRNYVALKQVNEIGEAKGIKDLTDKYLPSITGCKTIYEFQPISNTSNDKNNASFPNSSNTKTAPRFCSNFGNLSNAKPVVKPAPNLGFFNAFSLCSILSNLHYNLYDRCEHVFYTETDAVVFEIIYDEKYKESKIVFKGGICSDYLKAHLHQLKKDGSRIFLVAIGDEEEESKWNKCRFIKMERSQEETVIYIEHAANLTYDENTHQALTKFQFALDYGSDELQAKISNVRNNLKSPPKCGYSPNWISNHLMDFNAKITTKNVRQIEMKEIGSFVDKIGLIKLDRSQRKAVLNLLNKSTHAVIGGPGTGKSTVIAYAALYAHFKLKKKTLALSSRNSATDDVSNKIHLIVEHIRSHKIFPGNLERIVIRHVSSWRDWKLFDVNGNMGTDQEHMSYPIVCSTVGHAVSPDMIKFNADFTIIDEGALLTQVEFLHTIMSRRECKHNDSHHNCLKWPLKEQQLHFVGDSQQNEPKHSNMQVFDEKLAFDTGETMSPMHFFLRNTPASDRTVLRVCRRGPKAGFELMYKLFYPNDPKLEETVDEEFQQNESAITVNPPENSHVTLNKNNAYFSKFGSLFESCEKIDLTGAYFRGPGDCEEVANSHINRGFLELAVDIINDLTSFGCLGNGEKIKKSDILYITPYRGQLNLAKEVFEKNNLSEIQTRLSSQKSDDTNLRTFTIDQGQGNEAPIVIFDYVMTKKCGFLRGRSESNFGTRSNPRVIVGMTRHQNLLIIIGRLDQEGFKDKSDDFTAIYENFKNESTKNPLIKFFD